jgi:hypothetical protein
MRSARRNGVKVARLPEASVETIYGNPEEILNLIYVALPIDNNVDA